MIGNESDQIVLLNTIKKFWQKDEYYLRTYIEYFESKSILKTDLIIDWLFSELKNENDENTYSLFCWDFLLSIPLRLIRNLESHVKQQPSVISV